MTSNYRRSVQHIREIFKFRSSGVFNCQFFLIIMVHMPLKYDNIFSCRWQPLRLDVFLWAKRFSSFVQSRSNFLPNYELSQTQERICPVLHPFMHWLVAALIFSNKNVLHRSKLTCFHEYTQTKIVHFNRQRNCIMDGDEIFTAV